MREGPQNLRDLHDRVVARVAAILAEYRVIAVDVDLEIHAGDYP